MASPSGGGQEDGGATAEHRQELGRRPMLGGVPVRDADIEPTKGLRTVAILFRGMSILLVLLMVAQVAIGLTSAVPLSPGVVLADAVRLVIFAGLLWAAGDLAVLWVKSHHDLRATRILTARIEHLVHQISGKPARLPPGDAGTGTKRGP